MLQRVAGFTFVILLVATACSSGVSQDEFDAASARADDLTNEVASFQGQLSQAQADLTAARDGAAATAGQMQETIDGLGDQLAELQDQVSTLEEDLRDERSRANQLEDELGTAEEAADEALQQVADLLLAFDPEIRAAKQRLAADAEPLACDLGTQAALDGNSSPPSANSILQALGDLDAAAGFEVADLVDLEGLADTASGCFDEEELRLVLYGPHGSGFHTVGVEIGAGLWQSTGSQSDCYWARLDSNQGILDNHFGNAGGTVRVRASDFEVEFDGCGTWEYVGP